MRSLIVKIILFGIITNSCSKYNSTDNDISGDSYIRGRLFLYDTLTKHAVGDPLPNKIVQIFYSGSEDTLNNLSSVTTDKDGYFVFKNLDEKKIYRIYYEEKTDSNRIYKAVRNEVRPPLDTLALNASLSDDKLSGLLYTIKDSTGTAIKGASVCIYSNASFFTPGKCDNSSYSLLTDVYGHAFVFDIQAIKYYVTAFISINGIVYLGNDTVEVGRDIKYRTVILSKASQTGYNYHVVDSLGTAIPGVQLCFFTSAVLFSTGNCNASSFKSTSDSNGNGQILSINPSTYYVSASITLDSLTLSGKDTVRILKDMILKDTITLKSK